MFRKILLTMDAVLAKASKLLLWIVGVPFFSALIMEVIARKVFNHSIFGVYEMEGFMATWVSMLGAYLAYRNREMARLGFILERLSPLWRHRLELLNKLLVFVALILLGISGLMFVTNPAVSAQSSISFGIPVIYAYVGIPIGIFLMAFETLLLLLIKGVDTLDQDNKEEVI